MNPLHPLPLQKIHIIGIGGIGMSGIAEILRHQGYVVQGSDQSESANVERLRKGGIQVFLGHDGAHITEDLSVVVHSTAVKATNPEIEAAHRLGVPVINRAEMLAELMRFYWTIAVSGTHGKTTTTSLVGHVLDSIDPTVINGGIVHSYGTNVKIGNSRWMIVEADESDATFVHLPASIAVVTNIDKDHLDHYKTFEALKDHFARFIHNLPFYGFAVVCSDDPVVREVMGALPNHRVIPYGLEPGAQVRAINLRTSRDGTCFDVLFEGLPFSKLTDVFLPMMGLHNVQNALSAITIALKMGLSDHTIKESLAAFQGVKRRFTRTGTYAGCPVIDDYAHHPAEVTAVLKAARQATSGRLFVIFEPHRYSRLSSLFGDFVQALAEADRLLLLPVFGAGETPLTGVSHDKLGEALEKVKGKSVALSSTLEDVQGILDGEAAQGDMILFLGAGSITKWAHELPGRSPQ